MGDKKNQKDDSKISDNSNPANSSSNSDKSDDKINNGNNENKGQKKNNKVKIISSGPKSKSTTTYTNPSVSPNLKIVKVGNTYRFYRI